MSIGKAAGRGWKACFCGKAGASGFQQGKARANGEAEDLGKSEVMAAHERFEVANGPATGGAGPGL